MKRSLKWTIALVVLSLAGTARAQQPEFGDVGHIAISAERLFGFVHSTETISFMGTSVDTSIDTFTLLTNPYGALTGYAWPRVAVDVFVAPRITVGGAVGFVHISPSEGSLTGFLLAPRVGYAAHLTPKLGIWPRGGITFQQVSTDDGPGSMTTKQTAFALTLEAPLVITLAPRVAVTVGPTLDLGLGGSQSSGGASVDDKFTDFGIQAGLFVLL